MKKFIKDYIKIIGISMTGLIFALASFYLIMNYNHNEELQKTLYIGENEVYYTKQKEILNDLHQNLTTFKNKKNNNQSYQLMYQSLTNCSMVLEEDGTLFRINPNNNYTSYEIYQLGENFQTKVMNSCYFLNLSFLQIDEVPNEFKNVAPFIKSYVNSINQNVGDSLSEIQNNSSYFYSTNITYATIRNYLGSSYKTIASSYNDFASILLYLSEYINNGGQND